MITVNIIIIPYDDHSVHLMGNVYNVHRTLHSVFTVHRVMYGVHDTLYTHENTCQLLY